MNMNLYIKILTAIFIVLVIGSCTDEQTYQGKPAVHWIKLLNDAEPAQRMAALRAVGSLANYNPKHLSIIISAFNKENNIYVKLIAYVTISNFWNQLNKQEADLCAQTARELFYIVRPNSRITAFETEVIQELLSNLRDNPITCRPGVGINNVSLLLGAYDLARHLQGIKEDWRQDANIVASSALNELYHSGVIRAAGSPTVITTGLSEPRGMKAYQDKYLVIADTGNHLVKKISMSGELLLSIGGKGKNPGQFNQPSDVCIGDDESILVADTWNHRIQQFDSEGHFVRQWGEEGCDKNKIAFWAPKGIFFSQKHFIYVVSTGCNEILQFDINGNLLSRHGDMNDDISKRDASSFHEPVGITESSSGQIYVADTANHRIRIFSPDLTPSGSFDVTGWDEYYTEPFLSFSQDNKLYISDAFNSRILVYSQDGTFLYWIDWLGEDAPKLDISNNYTRQCTSLDLVKGLCLCKDTLFILPSASGKLFAIPISSITK